MSAAVLTFLAACLPPGAAATRAGDAARDAIMATSREFSARYVRGDIEGLVALYTTDGVILPPGRPIIRGHAALLDYWTLAPGLRVVEHRASPDSVVVVEGTAYDWGTYIARTVNAEGEERTTRGKYVIVWRETASGRWQIHVDMWNPGS